MKNHGRVKSAVKPDAIRVDEFAVWVHSNIVPISEPSTGEDEGGGFEGFEFNMVQYTKDEWIQFLSESLFDVVDTIDPNAAPFGSDAADIEAGGLKLAMFAPNSSMGKQMEARLQELEAKFAEGV